MNCDLDFEWSAYLYQNYVAYSWLKSGFKAGIYLISRKVQLYHVIYCLNIFDYSDRISIKITHDI